MSTNTFSVESNIPLPETRGKYPFATMKIGDSFFVSDMSLQKAVGVSASNYGLRNDKKFSIRTLDGGFRVWRIS